MRLALTILIFLFSWNHAFAVAQPTCGDGYHVLNHDPGFLEAQRTGHQHPITYARTNRGLDTPWQSLRDFYPTDMFVDLPGKSVLDAGCGPGALFANELNSGRLNEFFPNLPNQGRPAYIAAVDLKIDKSAYGKPPTVAKQLFDYLFGRKPPEEPKTLDVRQADVLKLPFEDGKFDVLFSSFALHHYEFEFRPESRRDRTAAKAALVEFHRVLKVGGVVRMAAFSDTGVAEMQKLVAEVPGLKWKRKVAPAAPDLRSVQTGNPPRTEQSWVIELEKTSP